MVEGEPIARGWHQLPGEGDHWRYWDGRTWTAQAHTSNGVMGVRVIGVSGARRGWRGTWFLKVARLPVVFYPLAWFNCSVPLTRGRLDRFLRPREVRELRSIPPPSPPPDAPVREPRSPHPSSPAQGAARNEP